MKKRITAFPVFLVCLTILVCLLGAQGQKRQPSGLFPILKNGKWGYINRSGQVAIQPEFDYATPFFDGMAFVSTGGKPGYIDPKGKLVIELKINRLNCPKSFIFPCHLATYSFAEGLALIAVGGELRGRHYPALHDAKYGYVDKAGRIAIQPQFDFADSFSEGLALVKIGNSGQQAAPEYGYINRSGQVVIQPQFRDASPFSEGLAQVRFLNEDGKGWHCGYIDKRGELVIQPQFSACSSFSEELAGVQIDGKYGYIDKTGQLALRPQFDFAGHFSEGLARVGIGPIEGSQYGYIDRQGQMVIKLQSPSVPCLAPILDVFSLLNWSSGAFSEGLASVYFKDGEQGKCGYIDRTGKTVIEPQFEQAGPFREGLAPVTFRGQAGKLRTGYVDKSGKHVWEVVVEEKKSAFSLAMERWAEIPAPQLAYTGKEDAEDRGKEISRYWFTIANREAYRNELFKPSSELPPMGRFKRLPRAFISFHDTNDRQIGRGAQVADLDRIGFSVDRGEQPPKQVYVKIYNRQVKHFKRSNLVNIDEQGQSDKKFKLTYKSNSATGATVDEDGQWQIFKDSRSRFQENSIFDLTQIAVRRPSVDSVEFQTAFGSGVPESGNVVLWVDTDRSRDTGTNIWGDIGADRKISISLAKGQATVSGKRFGLETKETYQTSVERLENQVLVKVEGWNTGDFDFVVMENAGPFSRAKIAYPWSANSCDITVDGRSGDWDDRKPIWTSSEPELPAAIALGDLRKVWFCNQGETLFGRIEFPRRSLLYGDNDVSHGEPDVSVWLDEGERWYRYSIVPGSTYQLRPKSSQPPSDAVFKSIGPVVEFEIKNVGSPLFAPGTTRDIRIGTGMQKIDFIPDSAQNRQGHLEFRSGSPAGKEAGKKMLKLVFGDGTPRGIIGTALSLANSRRFSAATAAAAQYLESGSVASFIQFFESREGNRQIARILYDMLTDRYLAREEWEETIDLAEEWLSADPEYLGTILAYRTLAYRGNGEVSLARQSFQQLMDRTRHPDFSSGAGDWNSMVQLLPRLGVQIENPKLLSPIRRPRYTQAAIKARVQGTILLAVWVDTDGSIQDIEILTGLGHGLDKAARRAVRKAKFRPARIDGRPLKAPATVEFTFKLR